MKTQAQALARYEQSTSTGEQTWVENLQNTNKPIVAAAINRRAAALSGYAQALAPGGIWERNLSAVGDAGIKAAAAAKRSNYTTGVTQGASKFGTAIGKILAYEAQGLQTVQQMKANGQSGKAVMNYWFDYMSAGRGQLGAAS